MRIGACDLCEAQNVELSRGDVAGLETWYCADGCRKSTRIVPCQCCGTEGRIYIETYQRDEYGNAMERVEECEACDGTGGEIVETEPVTLEDLAEIPSL